MSTQPANTKIIRCCNCRGMIRVAVRALSLFCPHCQSRVSAEDLRVSGSHPGKQLATAGDILVEQTARLHLDLVGKCVTIHGRVHGAVTADVLVEIGPSGCVIGDVRAPRLVMRDGGVMRGRFERLAAQAADAAATPTTADNTPGSATGVHPVERSASPIPTTHDLTDNVTPSRLRPRPLRLPGT